MTGDPSAFERIAAAAEEAAISCWRRRQHLLATVAIVAASLTFPVGLVLLLGWGRELAADVAARERIRVFLVDDARPEEVDAVEAALLASPGISRAERVSRDQARAILLRRFPELEATIQQLGPEALALPQGIEAAGDGAPATLEQAAKRVSTLPGVEEVRYDAAAVDRLARVQSALAATSSLIALIALTVAAAVIGNVIRIGALSRREQLAVMRLVGAPRFHARAPFVLEGLVQGALSGAAAGLALVLARWLLREPLARVLPASAEGVGQWAITLLVVGPGLAGAVAAWWAVESVLRRHARLER